MFSGNGEPLVACFTLVVVCVLSSCTTIDKGSVYSLDWTAGLDYWAGLQDWTTGLLD